MRAVVLGGGPGGLAAANRLRELAGDRCSVTVVDRSPDFSFGLSWLWAMLGKRPEEVTSSRERLRDKGIDFLKAEVTGIDCAGRRVVTSARVLEYDFLVVAMGSELAPGKVKGLRDAGYFTMYTLEGAMALHDALRSFEGGSVVVVICSTPFKCPAAPYEAAMLIDDYLCKKDARDRTRLQVFTPEPLPMPTAGEAVGNALLGLLRERRISFHGGRKLAEVMGEEKTLVFEDGTTENYDLLIAIPPHAPPEAVRASGLAGESGWIPVDRETMETRFEGVFALGDVASIALPSGKPLPKTATFALSQGEVVASNIASRIHGVPGKRWDGYGECFVEVGKGMAAFGAGSFYAAPHPVVALQAPSGHFRTLKEQWERYWRQRLL